MEGGKKLIAQGLAMGHTDPFKKTDQRALPLLTAGRALYAGIAKMQGDERRGEVNVENLPRMAKNAALNVVSSPLGALVALGVALYLLGAWKGEE
jgi:hypothetical protein